MKVGHIDTTKQVFVIAEIGNNHEGDFSLARKMVTLAAEAGADAVKFQTIVPELLVSSADQKRIDQLKKFQFSHEQFVALAEQAKQLGLVFCSTPFDHDSARFLNTIQPIFKIASGDNNFFSLIEIVATFGKPVMISTGLADLDLLQDIHTRVQNIWAKNSIVSEMAFLHCVGSYPVPMEQANLGAVATLKKHFPEVTVGYSDHTLGFEAATLAVAAGARIIEKHFTLDKNYSDFRDHQLSADPEEMRCLVQNVRKANKMMGGGIIGPQDCEKDMPKAIRRSIAVCRDVPEGHILSQDDLICVRPGTGIPPEEEKNVAGRAVNRNLSKGEIIQPGDMK